MNLTDKKYIPFYIMGAVIVLLCITLAFLIADYPFEKEEQTTPTTENTTVYKGDGVPDYDIPASAFKPENFALGDNSRIIYTDSSVPWFTGVDVSSFQKDIDWEKVASDGIDFAIVRIGLRGYGKSGQIYSDDYGKKNIEGALAAGLKVGVYFFSQAINPEEAKEEAQFVLQQIEGYRIDYPVVFDWEHEPDMNMRTDVVDNDTLTNCAVAFCETIKNAGYKPAVYFNLNYGYLRYNLDSVKNYTFWYAQHKGTQPEFYYNYSIWQYSASGKVNGIPTDVDLNISFTDY